ncbi:MAG: ComF family protein [Planctomycetaceae bacterium]|nr:ComF family protein [Planctomycetaceae bacterium]
MATLWNSWQRLTRDAVNFVYPRSCVRCDTPLSESDAGFASNDEAFVSRFCRDCHRMLCCSIALPCLRCGAPVGPHLNTENGCRHCRRDQFQFDRVFALGIYEDALRACCLRVKQGSGGPLTAGLTDLLWTAYREEWSGLGIDLVVPIPHSWFQRAARRHLPPVTMSHVLARRLKVPQELHILSKPRHTPAQTSLTPAGRRTNLRNAFRIDGGARLDGLTILLTDDILTTGTTADRATRVLKDAGAKRIHVVVIARGVGQSSRR